MTREPSGCDHEPWVTWGLEPYVPDNRSTSDQIEELIQTLPTSGLGGRACGYTRHGIHGKRMRCDSLALPDSIFCARHQIF